MTVNINTTLANSRHLCFIQEFNKSLYLYCTLWALRKKFIIQTILIPTNNISAVSLSGQAFYQPVQLSEDIGVYPSVNRFSAHSTTPNVQKLYSTRLYKKKTPINLEIDVLKSKLPWLQSILNNNDTISLTFGKSVLYITTFSLFWFLRISILDYFWSRLVTSSAFILNMYYGYILK